MIRATAAATSIVGISAAAASPEASAMSDGEPPIASSRRGRNVNPAITPTKSIVAAVRTRASRGATRSATPADPDQEPRAASLAEAPARRACAARSARWTSGTRAAITAMDNAARPNSTNAAA